MSTPITVEIWSDIACPWCYIGKRRFEQGLAAFDGRDDVTVTYRSYELAPDTPTDFDGSEVDFLVGHKGMSPAQVEQMLDEMTQLAAVEGLAYDFDALHHTNTRLAHRALHLARTVGCQRELAERLFAAYFTEGRHLGRPEELADLAAEVGLDRASVLEALAGDEFVAEVDADIAQARAHGISGVPFFVLDGRYGISGAQPAAAFTSALEQVVADRRDSPTPA
ncbi:disulfide bond formation protein DsbA [Williamsia sp. Leaf354]|uniref:DsbA family oxidoreductase n=1 Tax=Williamsia sp. Leaf354 TaxID=1736349 RepID=UPI0006F1E887|nr:DsbA family oxidoreductase [Williamsia sp. Leaf354]KQS00332.1 disulfide bond formation protein DsbA [Williamsia sp. Leaf354]